MVFLLAEEGMEGRVEGLRGGEEILRALRLLTGLKGKFWKRYDASFPVNSFGGWVVMVWGLSYAVASHAAIGWVHQPWFLLPSQPVL